MTPREVITCIFNKEIPDRMGLNESFWPETINQYWPKQGYPEGEDPAVVFDHDVRSAGGWFDTSPFPGQWDLLDETDEWHVRRDGRGAALKYWKNKSGTPEHIDFECCTSEVWKNKYREPLLATDVSRLNDMPATKATLAKIKEDGYYSVMSNLFVYELMRGTIGDQNFLPAMLDEPEWIHDFCQVHTDHMIRHYEILFREVGVPDGFFIYEDLGYRNGLFCSPATLYELWFPYTKRLVSFLKDYGMQVMLHSCGDARQAIPMIIETGVDVLQPMEAKVGINVVELGQKYAGKLGFMGNLDAQILSTNDKSAVEAEVVGKLKAIKANRIPYVFHSDHSIPPDVTYDTYKFMLELYKEHRDY